MGEPHRGLVLYNLGLPWSVWNVRVIDLANGARFLRKSLSIVAGSVGMKTCLHCS